MCASVSELGVVACTDSLTTSLLGVLKLLLLFIATHVILGESMGPVQGIGLAVVLIGMLVYRSSLASSSSSSSSGSVDHQHKSPVHDGTPLIPPCDGDEDSEAKAPDRAARARAQAAGKAQANAAAARAAATEAAAASAATDGGAVGGCEMMPSTLKERPSAAPPIGFAHRR